MINSKRVGMYIRNQRKVLNLTQKDLADKLNISFQAVSKWETGETLPDVGILLTLSEILNTSTDKILLGGKVIHNNQKFIDVNGIAEGFKTLENLRYYFGKDSSFYQGAIEGINNRMNIDFEEYMRNDYYKEVMFAEVVIQYLMNGYSVDLNDVKQHIKSDKMLGIVKKYLGSENSVKSLTYEENPNLFTQIRKIKPEFENISILHQLPGEYIGMDVGKTYWGLEVETNNEWCYGIVVDERTIYIHMYEAQGKNQKLIHEEKIEV